MTCVTYDCRSVPAVAFQTCVAMNALVYAYAPSRCCLAWKKSIDPVRNNHLSEMSSFHN